MPIRRVSNVAATLLLASGVWGCASGATYAQRGDELAAKGEFEGAMESYFQALEEEPEFVPAHLGLARIYLEQDRLEDADKAVNRAQAVRETDDGIWLLALVRFKQRKYREAGRLLDDALQKRPDDPDLHFVMGLVRRDAGDIERSADSFEMVLTLDPKRVDARVEFAAVLQRLKRHQDALDVLTEASKQVKGRLLTQVYAAKGEVYEAMGMADYAEHEFGLALKRDPNNPKAKAGKARALRLGGKIAESVEFLQGAASQHPKNYGIHYELGVSFVEFRLEKQALEPLMKAVSLDPTKAQTYTVLLPLLEGDKAKASTFYGMLKKASDASPEDLELQLKLGRAAHKREDTEVAVIALQRVLEVEQSNVEANFLLGMSHVEMGDRDAALEDVEALRYIDAVKAEELMAAIERADEPAGSGKGKRRKNKGKRRRRKGKRRRK